jgi:hypothetical protein
MLAPVKRIDGYSDESRKEPETTQTNSAILRGYFDEVVNQRRLDLIPKYHSEKFVGHGTPYVDLGMAMDQSSGANSASRW